MTMKVSLLPIIVPLIIALLIIAKSKLVLVQDTDFAKERAQVEKTIRNDVIKPSEGNAWLKVKPNEISSEDHPKLKEINEKFGFLWIEINYELAAAYTVAVRAVNLKNNPDAAKISAPLLRAFQRALDARGGGSACALLRAFSPAHVEWMVGNLNAKQYEQISDEEFISKLARLINTSGSVMLESEIRSALPAVLKDVELVESMLPDHQKGFIRSEFLHYLDW